MVELRGCQQYAVCKSQAGRIVTVVVTNSYAMSLVAPLGLDGLEDAFEKAVEKKTAQWVSLFCAPLYAESSAESVCFYFCLLMSVEGAE